MQMKRLLLIVVFIMGGMMSVMAQGAPDPINDALADLNAQLGTNYTLNDIAWYWEQENYPDTSLGCPQEGQVYAQQLSVGYRFVFTVNGNNYDYRVAADRSIMFLCSTTPVEDEEGGNSSTPDFITSDYTNPLCPVPPEDIAYMQSRLTTGIQARVQPGLPNRVRAEPNVDAAQTGEIPGEGIFSVIEGPVCDDQGYLWWQIDYDGFVGWTSEGRDGDYFIEPLPPATLPTTDIISADNLSLISELSRFEANLGVGLAWSQNTETDAPPRLLVTGDSGADGAWVIDTATSNETPRFISASDMLTVADFGPDNNLALLGSADGSLRLWDLRSGAVLVERAVLQGHDSPVQAVALSADGAMLAGSGGRAFLSENRDDNLYAISVWDVDSVSLIGGLRGHTDSVTDLVFTDDNSTIISGSLDGFVHVWSVAGLQETSFIEIGEPITSIALSPNQTTLAIGTQTGSIALWDLPSNTAIATLSGHVGAVNSVNFNSDGSLLVSGGDDNIVYLWNTGNDASEPVALNGHTDAINTVAFSPDGTLVGSISEDNSVRMWGISADSVG